MPLPGKFRMALRDDPLPVPRDTPMGGYGWGTDRRFTGEPANPLKIRCVIIVSPQGQRIVLVQVDVISIPKPVYDDILDRLRDEGVVDAARNFVLAQSHTHAGPMVGAKPDPLVLLGSADAATVTEAYTRTFVNEVVATAVRAHQTGLTEVTLGYAEGFAEIGRNRVGLAYTPREVPVLVARRTDANRNLFAVLVGHTCHPVCSPYMGNNTDSDYCGYAVDEVEKRLGVPTVFFQGAAGDINPVQTDTAWAALRLTNAIVATVRNAAFFPIYGPIVTNLDVVPLPLAVNLDDPGERAALRQRYVDRVNQNAPGGVEQAGVRHARKMIAELDDRTASARMPMTIQKIDLGGLTILTMAHEVLSGYHVGTKAKWVVKNPLQPLWIMAYANHIDCYVPAHDVLKRGGDNESGWNVAANMIGVGTYGHSYSMVSPLAAGVDQHDTNGVEGTLVPRIAGILGL
ncbi:hypothetical protein LFM09_01780 [Lentzea alba]|uniref:hypothetical protein n=1 Tax=Lentzea alba TaxID=2714351 RepID=UPI0039BEE1E7